jgi:hypothetical protein
MSESKLKLLRKQLKFLDHEIEKLIQEKNVCSRCKRCLKGSRKRCRNSKTKKLLKGHYYGRRCPNKSRKTCYKQKGGYFEECERPSKEEMKIADDIIKTLNKQTGGGYIDYTQVKLWQKGIAHTTSIIACLAVSGLSVGAIAYSVQKIPYGVETLLWLVSWVKSGYDFTTNKCDKQTYRLLRSALKVSTGVFTYGQATVPSCSDMEVMIEQLLIALGVTTTGSVGLLTGGLRKVYNKAYDWTLRKIGCYEFDFDPKLAAEGERQSKALEEYQKKQRYEQRYYSE